MIFETPRLLNALIFGNVPILEKSLKPITIRSRRSIPSPTSMHPHSDSCQYVHRHQTCALYWTRLFHLGCIREEPENRETVRNAVQLHQNAPEQKVQQFHHAEQFFGNQSTARRGPNLPFRNRNGPQKNPGSSSIRPDGEFITRRFLGRRTMFRRSLVLRRDGTNLPRSTYVISMAWWLTSGRKDWRPADGVMIHSYHSGVCVFQTARGSWLLTLEQ